MTVLRCGHSEATRYNPSMACAKRVNRVGQVARCLIEDSDPFFTPLAALADNMPDHIVSLGEGPYIGQHVSTLFFREASLPRRHIWFAAMEGLEQISIGLLPDRR